MSGPLEKAADDSRQVTGQVVAGYQGSSLVRRLSMRLDPMPTARATAAIRELCEHLTATGTRYPGTDLTLRYEIKTRP